MVIGGSLPARGRRGKTGTSPCDTLSPMKLREMLHGEAALYLGAGAVAFTGLGLLLGYAFRRKETPRAAGWLSSPTNIAYGPQPVACASCDGIESWLQRRTTVQEVEGGGAEIPWAGIMVGAPESQFSREWAAFKASMRPGDELWTFSSPEESWRALAGRGGIALVRGGQVVDSIVTILN